MVFYKKTLLAPRCLSDKKLDWPLCLYWGWATSFPGPFPWLGAVRAKRPFSPTSCPSRGRGPGNEVEGIGPL